MIIYTTNTTFGYAGRPVVRVEELRVQIGRCLGIFGPNGAGKTTLVRGIVGLLKPLSGDVIRSPDLRLGYLPQHRHLDLSWPMTGFDAAAMAVSARRRLGWIGGERRSILDMMRRLGVDALAR